MLFTQSHQIKEEFKETRVFFRKSDRHSVQWGFKIVFSTGHLNKAGVTGETHIKYQSFRDGVGTDGGVGAATRPPGHSKPFNTKVIGELENILWIVQQPSAFKVGGLTHPGTVCRDNSVMSLLSNFMKRLPFQS